MWRPLKWLLGDRAGILLILAVGIAATAVITFAVAPSHASDPDSFLAPKDGRLYSSMAQSFIAGDEFRDPSGERSHKMSPLFPMFISLFMAALGTSETTVRIASFASYLLAAAALHRSTSDLFGNRAGQLLAAGYSVCPLVIKNTATYTSDNLIVATFALMLWSVLRATREPRMMIIAGILAGGLSLLRAGFLPFLLMGAACGLTWRLRLHGLAPLKCPFYLSGGALFVSMNIAWAARNQLHFGDLRGDPYLHLAVERLLAAPAHHSVTSVALQAVLAILMFGLLGLCFRKEIAQSLDIVRHLISGKLGRGPARASLPLAEWTSGLWLAFFLSAGFLVLVSAAFLNLEVLAWVPARAATAEQMLHRIAFNGYWRYYLPTAVPLVWLGFLFAPARLTGGGRAARTIRIAATRDVNGGGAKGPGRKRGPHRVPEAV